MIDIYVLHTFDQDARDNYIDIFESRMDALALAMKEIQSICEDYNFNSPSFDNYNYIMQIFETAKYNPEEAVNNFNYLMSTISKEIRVKVLRKTIKDSSNPAERQFSKLETYFCRGCKTQLMLTEEYCWKCGIKDPVH